MANILIGKKIENQSPFIVKINNKTYETYEDKTLLRFLRDDLHITSVKDGCSQGACGTCTVIVDDKRYPACTQKLSKLKDKEVLTIEGLSDKEKDAFVYAFGKVGAVQCGFCTPGMVMSGMAIIKSNPNPSREEIANGIKSNICRCTGYVKII